MNSKRFGSILEVIRLTYRQRDEWLKGNTNMWDVFLDDMDLDNSIELALANLDVNEPVLEPVTFGNGDTFEGSSCEKSVT